MGSKPSTPIKSLENIVQIVLEQQYPLDEFSGEYVNFDKSIEDELKPLKTLATELVVEQFFQTETTLYRFLNTVYSNFQEAIKLYRDALNISEADLFFLYKGGNILRFISREFLLQIPASAHQELKDFYSPFFKRSDADFSIFISPELEDYDAVHYDMGILSYLVQDRIRSIFLANPEHYFDFLRFKRDYRERILAEYLEKFNQLEGFKFERLHFLENYVSQSDFTVIDKEAELRRTKIKDSNSYLTISYNDALSFYTGVNLDRLSHFTLVRTKIFFNLIDHRGSLLKIGGELIDVGIDYTDDVKNIHLIENLNHAITVYHIDHAECRLSFNSFTVYHLIYDLEEILFEKVKFPWEDIKYGKRINRLCYMYFVDAFLGLGQGQQRLELFSNLEDILSKILDGEDSSDRLIEFENNYQGLGIVHLSRNLGELIYKVTTELESTKLNEFVRLLMKNIRFVTDVLDKIKDYCYTEGYIDPRDIYSGGIDNML